MDAHDDRYRGFGGKETEVMVDLIPFRNLINERTGLYFEDGRLVKLGDAIRSIMTRKGIKSHGDYYGLLLQKESELTELVNLLTINETYFYRETAHLNIFAERLVPDLLRRKPPGTKIRVLSAGCSTGEEPYSLAIIIREKFSQGIGRLFQIHGVDIDSNAIAKATGGIYGRQSFRCFDPDLRDKYFQKVGVDRYQIEESLRQSIEFRVLNLLSGVYPENLRKMDVIFYRNVSIYFDAETQKRIFERLSEILEDKGYLIMSSTETLSHNLDILPLVEMQGAFLYQKNKGEQDLEKVGGRRLEREAFRSRGERRAPCFDSPHDVDLLPKKAGFPSRSDLPKSRGEKHKPDVEKPAPGKSKSPESMYDEALSLARGKRYQEALELIDEHMLASSPPGKASILKADILLNDRRLEEAAAVCSRLIEMDQLCLEAYLLLGLIARAGRKEEDALKWFKAALYVRPSCWLAHYYLGEIHTGCGERQKACREYAILIKVLEEGGLSDTGLPLFSLALPAEQMMHLCRHKLSQLSCLRQ